MRRRDRALTRSSHQSKIIQESVSIAWLLDLAPEVLVHSSHGSLCCAPTTSLALLRTRRKFQGAAAAVLVKMFGLWRYPFVHLRPALYVMRQRHRQRFLSFHKRSGRISHGVRQRDRQRLFYGCKRAGISWRDGSGRHL